METINATRLQRETRTLLDAAQHRGEAFEVQRHGETVAYLVPADQDLLATFDDQDPYRSDAACACKEGTP